MRRKSKRSRATRRPDTPRIKITGPADFLAIVPYLLGFHPTRSLVALFFDRGRVVLTARLDLPGQADAPISDALADQLVQLADHVRAQSTVLVCYSDSSQRRPDLVRLAREDRLRLLEVVQASSTRWWSLLCTDPGCCPEEGTPYDLSGHPLCAEAVLAGLGAVPDRESVAALVAGPAAADIAPLETLGADALVQLNGLDRPTRRRRMRDLVASCLADGLTDPARVTDERCAELAALAVDLEVRDVAWAMMTREDAESHLALWRRVVSRTVDWLSPAPVGLVSIAAWLTGNGALLNCGIARLESIEPEYGLLRLLQDMSWRAIPPSAWEELGPAMRAELDLVGRGPGRSETAGSPVAGP